LKTTDLQKLGITIYDILNEVDILITDYSSIFIDFLLLNRPIFFLCPDIEEYDNNRGLLYSPLEFWYPGPISHTNDELVQGIISYKDNPTKYDVRRELLWDVFHKYKDDKSSKRVFENIILPNLK